MEVELIHWWENHQAVGKNTSAVLILRDGVISEVFRDQVDKDREDLLKVPQEGVTRQEIISLVGSYNRVLAKADRCRFGCAFNRKTLEGLECSGGVNLEGKSVRQAWEEFVSSFGDLTDVNHHLAMRLLQLSREERSGEIEITSKGFGLTSEAFVKYHERSTEASGQRNN